MSLKNIKVSLDLNKLDASRIKPGKNGEKYFDLILWANDAPDRYGNDYAVKPAYLKAEMEMNPRPRLPFVGNAKLMVPKGDSFALSPSPAPAPAAAAEDVPF